MDKKSIESLLDRFEKTGVVGEPNARVAAIVHRLTRDLMLAIEDLDITQEEFWQGLNFLAEAGRSHELGLIAPGLGLEHFLDLRLDEAETHAGLQGGTPRTIEGPLYVAGAPVCEGQGRLDDGETEGEVMCVSGVVRDRAGVPLRGARVEVWHANTLGNYSYFDGSQSPFNLRRTIIADEQGRYRFRTILPVGYSVPPGGCTDRLLQALGRHGTRPAHIHFFVTAPGHRKLTTQINIANDPHLWDDFAFGTREGLVPPIRKVDDRAAMAAWNVDQPFYEVAFDFQLNAEVSGVPSAQIERARACA